MSDSPNVELVRSIYAAAERGDYDSVEWAHPAIERVVADGLSPGSWTGVARMAEAFREFLGVWENHKIVVDEYRELDSDRVLVLTRRSGRGKASRLELGELDTRGAVVYHVRDGRVIRYVVWLDRDRALADLGIAPEGDAE